ncbi:ubiquinol-cytochrome c reductase complex assembly factor 2-like [Branchiostoma floridae x Branchiostoma belcheri]
MARYKQFLRLCQQWPLDSTKEGRDIAVAIRQGVAKAFKEGENTQVNPVECDRVYTSLDRLNKGHWKNKYPRRKPTTFTGLTLEDYKLVLASESLSDMQKTKKSTWQSIKEKFSGKEDSKEV